MEAAVVVRGATYWFDDLGHGTASDAEWLALIRAVELAQTLNLATIELVGDALAVILQARMALENSHAVQGHAATFRALTLNRPPPRIRWIKREQNLAGIALAARHPR
ncbi:MAG: reverse transcriptase-like protein [Hyphomicrobiales bacterium]|nr:MAG: reverse transcriptase-like protein [Hyphomicrobiales bacterium]